ncbi:RNA ligase family protein [Thermoproteota archaeon]
MKINDMPKLESPFVRKEIDGDYIVTPEIAEGMEWVFEDESVMAIEKLHGTNVSIVIQEGAIVSVWNRTGRVPFFNKGKRYIIEGLLESWERGYMDLLPDGQHFGELIGEKLHKNPYKIKGHLWIPFETFGQKHLRFKSWGKYPKDFDTITKWFEDGLIPLYASMKGDREGYVEGVVFTHPDGRMAKLRRDMFPNFKGRRHKR